MTDVVEPQPSKEDRLDRSSISNTHSLSALLSLVFFSKSIGVVNFEVHVHVLEEQTKLQSYGSCQPEK